MDIQETMQRILTEDGIKQDFEQTLPSRMERYLKVKPHGIVPRTEFAPASTECTLLFRDGHFYGCIALSQAVAEALARFLCRRNGWKPKKAFEKNVTRLRTREFISEETKDKLLRIWEERDDYHHLASNVETDRQRLEDIAYERVLLLKAIESDIFKFSIVDGKLVPREKKYWELRQDGTISVFLRLE